MTKEEMNKYAFKCMVKDNPDEAVKNLILYSEEIERLNNIIKTKDEGIKATTEELCETTEENENLKEVIETLKRTNLLLIKQKAKCEDDLYMLDERIDNAI